MDELSSRLDKLFVTDSFNGHGAEILFMGIANIDKIRIR